MTAAYTPQEQEWVKFLTTLVDQREWISKSEKEERAILFTHVRDSFKTIETPSSQFAHDYLNHFKILSATYGKHVNNCLTDMAEDIITKPYHGKKDALPDMLLQHHVASGIFVHNPENLKPVRVALALNQNHLNDSMIGYLALIEDFPDQFNPDHRSMLNTYFEKQEDRTRLADQIVQNVDARISAQSGYEHRLYSERITKALDLGTSNNLDVTKGAFTRITEYTFSNDKEMRSQFAFMDVAEKTLGTATIIAGVENRITFNQSLPEAKSSSLTSVINKSAMYVMSKDPDYITRNPDLIRNILTSDKISDEELHNAFTQPDDKFPYFGISVSPENSQKIKTLISPIFAESAQLRKSKSLSLYLAQYALEADPTNEKVRQDMIGFYHNKMTVGKYYTEVNKHAVELVKNNIISIDDATPLLNTSSRAKLVGEIAMRKKMQALKSEFNIT